MSEQTNTDMAQHFYRASAADFMKIPGSPIAYYISTSVKSAFENFPSLKTHISPKQGTSTGDDETYVRYWYEVDFNRIKFDSFSLKDALESEYVYFPLNKGGEYRKWFGNNEKVIKFGDGAYAQLLKIGNHLPSRELYFKKGITWSKITSGSFSCRFDEGFVFSSVGLKGFPCAEDEDYILAFMNSKVMQYLIRVISPTLSIISGDLEKIPCIISSGVKEEISQKSKRMKEIAVFDWDMLETSWGFKKLSLAAFGGNKIRSSYDEYYSFCESVVKEAAIIESEINERFVTEYGVEKEIDPLIDANDITLYANTTYRFNESADGTSIHHKFVSTSICELLSYSIGCMMGRYSLDKPGLILASQGETIQDYLAQIPSPQFTPDDDAILPLTDEEWFADDVTNRFREFVKVVWGEETLQENLNFVAESLCLHAIKPKKSETAMDTIRRYLSTQFFKDHMKTYKKRPIYWLFSSGKQKAFECLVYLHRYNEGTLARMRTEYVTPLMGKYESQIRHIEEELTNAAPAEKTKLSKAQKDYQAKLNELREFDSKLKHYADMRIQLDLDDGVKVNYGKFGDLLANVKDITGEKPKV